MCLYPRIIKNKKYISNKKNGGIVPVMRDKRMGLVPVGCGKCMECRKQKARNWQVRLLEEIKTERNGVMITLTFSNESIKEIGTKINKLEGYNRDNEIATIGMRRFLERWRKKYKKSVKHWFITELGHNGTENVHMHGIIWTDIKHDEIRRIWRYGFVWIGSENKGYVNSATVNYTVKYVHKQDELHTEYIPKVLTSKGIGKNYIKTWNSKRHKYINKNTKETYKTEKGHEIAMPIYYRNKIWTDEEREKLWIEKLDENIRYVNGIKIDVSETEEKYWKALKVARMKNKRLGYGDNSINWEKRKYENERRNINYMKRINNKKQENS